MCDEKINENEKQDNKRTHLLKETVIPVSIIFIKTSHTTEGL